MSLMLGDYWGCIGEDHVAVLLKFTASYPGYEVMASCEPVPEDVTGDVLTPLQATVGPFNVVMWVTRDDEGRPAIMSLYPYPARGTAVDVLFKEHMRWEENVEGNVVVTLRGFDINAFDPLYPVSREYYSPGAPLTISLSGMASAVHKLSTIAETTNGHLPGYPVAEVIEGVLAKDDSFFYRTQAEGQEELCGALARITGHRTIDFDGIEINEVTVRIMDEVEIPIYFGNHSVMTEGWVPKEGEYAAIIFYMFARRPSLDLVPFESPESETGESAPWADT